MPVDYPTRLQLITAAFDLQNRTLEWRGSSRPAELGLGVDARSAPAAVGGPGVVVDLERLLRRALPRPGVRPVDPDSIPRRATAAHRVDQHVGGFEVGDHLRVARFPAFEPLPRLLLGPGAG